MRAELTKGHQSLAKGERKRQSEAREFMGELGRAVAQGKATTQALLRDFGEVQAGARDEWQKMTATMQSKRGGIAVAVKPPIEEITAETATLREQVFEHLANHPDGTKLVELAEEFGVARIQIGKVIRNLMDENKVEKRGLLYFAV
jgi:predicted HTH transcriptional regulator